MSESESDDTLLLDEEDELYGYGVLNVNRNQFVKQLGGGPMGADPDIFNTEEEAVEHFEKLAEDLDGVSHLRIVRVHLDNGVDKKATECVK